MPNAHISWVVREDYADLVKNKTFCDQIFSLKRSDGLAGLIRLSLRLSQLDFTHVYDAHNNLRSRIFMFLFCMSRLITLKPSIQFKRRPKSRLKRLLLFSLGYNFLPKPFRGAESFLWPLKSWGVPQKLGNFPTLKTSHISGRTIGLVPSASSENKRWPVRHFIKLIELMPQHSFEIFGGPEDTFAEQISKAFPDRVQNYCGKLKFAESLEQISKSALVIGSDTGLTHAADLYNLPTIFLIGPSAFGYPSGANSQFVETDLECKPCSKDGHTPCRNAVLQKCMVDIQPEQVAKLASQALTKSL